MLAVIKPVAMNPENGELMVSVDHRSDWSLATPPDVAEPSYTWTCPSCRAKTRYRTRRLRDTLDGMSEGQGRPI